MEEQKQSVHELAREVPVRASADVVVVGGGLGGVAAAIAAARAGARTILVERNSFLGGNATAGMCCSIFNCYFTSSGHLGIHGIAVEIADALTKAAGCGERWRNHKGHIIYDLEQGKLVLQELVENAEAQVLLNSVVVDTVSEGNRLDAIIVESKSGREALRSQVFVDATGDADLVAMTGERHRVCEKGRHSLCFRLGNVDMDRFVDYFRQSPEQYPESMDVDWTCSEALAQYDDCGTFLFPHGGGIQMKALAEARQRGALPTSVGLHDNIDACQMHGLRSTGILHVITGFVHFDGLEVDLITRSLNDGRRMAFILADVYRKYLPGLDRSFVAGVAASLGVRVSRYLDAEFVLTSEMMLSGVRHDDAIGTGIAWDSPKRHRGRGAWSVAVLRPEPFDIPYRCILPRRIDGLVMGAGRSISAENHKFLRVMAETMVVGQGAGVAAAIAALTCERPRAVSQDAVRLELVRQCALVP